MSKLYVKKHNEVFFQLETSYEHIEGISKITSYKTANYFMDSRYKMGMWDGKISLFKKNTKLIPIGIFYKVIQYAKFHNLEIVISKTTLQSMKTEVDKLSFRSLINSYVGNPKIKSIHDYQLNAIYLALTKKRGIILSCTGSGKSLMIYGLFRYLWEQKKTKLVLVIDNKGLAEQMYNDFKDYIYGTADDPSDLSVRDYDRDGINEDFINDIAVFHSDSKLKDISKNIIITTYQSFVKQQHIYEDCEAVLVDESQIAKSTSVNTILSGMVNAEYRIGTTATLPEQELEQATIIGYLGRVLIEVGEQELIKIGQLSPVKIHTMMLDYLPDDDKEDLAHSDWDNALSMVSSDENRLRILDRMITDGDIGLDENTFLLFKRRASITLYEEYLRKHHPEFEVFVIHGSISVKKREEIRQYMKTHSGCILAATMEIVSKGLNLPLLHNLVLCNPFKSKIYTIQSIGRVLRKHATKEYAHVYDLVDYSIFKRKRSFIMKHWIERFTTYLSKGHFHESRIYKFIDGEFIKKEDSKIRKFLTNTEESIKKKMDKK